MQIAPRAENEGVVHMLEPSAPLTGVTLRREQGVGGPSTAAVPPPPSDDGNEEFELLMNASKRKPASPASPADACTVVEGGVGAATRRPTRVQRLVSQCLRGRRCCGLWRRR